MLLAPALFTLHLDQDSALGGFVRKLDVDLATVQVLIRILMRVVWRLLPKLANHAIWTIATKLGLLAQIGHSTWLFCQFARKILHCGRRTTSSWWEPGRILTHESVSYWQ